MRLDEITLDSRFSNILCSIFVCPDLLEGDFFFFCPTLSAPAPTVGALFSSRVSFHLAGLHWVQFQQTENLLTFEGKYTFSNVPFQVILAGEIFLHV